MQELIDEDIIKEVMTCTKELNQMLMLELENFIAINENKVFPHEIISISIACAVAVFHTSIIARYMEDFVTEDKREDFLTKFSSQFKDFIAHTIEKNTKKKNKLKEGTHNDRR